MNDTTLLSGTNLVKTFRTSQRSSAAQVLTALDRVSIQVTVGETVGIAGESGCGKSTLAKVMCGLMEPDSGEVSYRGGNLKQLSREEHTIFRRSTQMIFQDPFSSLNPRLRIGDSIAEPLQIADIPPDGQRAEVARLMNIVGLNREASNRFPDEFSGGQRQRIGIARALAARPEILIADEPVSSLDISIQAQIINLLLQMKSDLNLSMMIISHNLLVLHHICDRIMVMYLGAIVESAPAASLFRRCRHPYTEALIAAIPGLATPAGATTERLSDDIPSALAIPSGCRFHPRCRHAEDICHHTPPPLVEYAPNHTSACHFSTQLYG
ncbi:MAG TPA: ABC transporter ATP-binding protein [Desulfuromonadales bacterium]|nr:ABC transporter ATP-binding protein [Desulfuromonadales bacterium]